MCAQTWKEIRADVSFLISHDKTKKSGDIAKGLEALDLTADEVISYFSQTTE